MKTTLKFRAIIAISACILVSTCVIAHAVPTDITISAWVSQSFFLTLLSSLPILVFFGLNEERMD